MYRGLYSFALAVITSIVVMSSGHAADIAIVDFADQWNNKACLGPLLDDLGQRYDDITGQVEKGDLNLSGYRILIIGAFATNNATLHNSLDNNAAEIERFLSDGGIVIELTQADQNQAAVDWLPGDLKATRTDLDYAQIVILEKDHPIFHVPNELTEDALSNWGISSGGWSTAWETFGTHSGFTVVAARDAKGTSPCILEATYKKGRIMLLSIALDKKHALGTTPASKENSMLLMENILAEYLVAVEARGRFAITWGRIKI
jgi:hypothetical protein